MRVFDYPACTDLDAALQAQLDKRKHFNVYRMLMHTPNMAPAFYEMSDAIRHHASLKDELKELAIIRTGWRYQARYEIHHHTRMALQAGLPQAVADVALSAQSGAELPAPYRDVLWLTDTILDKNVLDAAAVQRARGFLSDNQIMDLIFTVGFYQTVCCFLNTTDVDIEEQA